LVTTSLGQMQNGDLKALNPITNPLSHGLPWTLFVLSLTFIRKLRAQQTEKVLIFPIPFLITGDLWQGFKPFLRHNTLLLH